MRLWLCVLFVFICGLLSAQTAMDLVGRGEDFNFDNADRQAIRDLCSQISIQVKVENKDTVRENDNSVSQISEQVIETYSSVILENVERKVMQNADGKWIVQRILTQEARESLFQHRKQKIMQYISTAQGCEENGEIGLALKNYYWALLLLRSMPSVNSVYLNDNPKDKLVLTFLMNQIQTVLNTLTVQTESIEDERNSSVVYFKAAYQGNPVASLNLQYFDGVQPTVTQLKDGKGVIYLPASMVRGVENLNVTVDYEYLDFLKDYPQDEEVKAVSAVIQRISFDNKKRLSFKSAPTTAVSNNFKPKNDAVTDKEESASMPLTPDLNQSQMTAVQALLDYLHGNQQQDLKPYCSAQGYTQLMKVLNYGKVKIYKGSYDLKSYPMGKQTMVRSIPLEIVLKDKNRKIIREDISLILENDKIAWVNFTINDHYMENNLRKGNNLGDISERLKSVQFIEYYKTMYALKEIDKISDIFADSALIFIGYVKAKVPVDKNLQDVISKEMNKKEMEVQKLTKTQFIDRTRKIFQNNQVINLQFDDIQIIKRSKEKAIYAVQMKQDYYSTNYSDKGYLLLFYDMSDTENPKIFFRYWQPSKMMPEEVDAFERMTGRFRF